MFVAVAHFAETKVVGVCTYSHLMCVFLIYCDRRYRSYTFDMIKRKEILEGPSSVFSVDFEIMLFGISGT